MSKYKNLKECIEQLEKVGYKDEFGHKLEMNEAFIQLKDFTSKNCATKRKLKKLMKEEQQEGCSTIIHNNDENEKHMEDIEKC